MRATLKIAVIAGEESGQLLAADLADALKAKTQRELSLMGVGAAKLEALGLQSLFDPDEIALTGISSVVSSLPKLLKRVKQTADAIIAAQPDCLILIDSPDFSLRVAKRVKANLPDLPIVKYVAPTVWAWRPGRAAKMIDYVDHVLAILPFEPKIMKELGGPETHYVGHRLLDDSGLLDAWQKNRTKKPSAENAINLVVLPGSRTGEIQSLMPAFSKTIELLQERGHSLKISIPTLKRHEAEVRRFTAAWQYAPEISTTREEQIHAYKNADAALAASGTVTLELALAGVPAVSCYKVDALMKLATRLITAWSAALPNLIADKSIIREYYNEQVRPGMLARHLEDLAIQGHTRSATMNGYALVRETMQIDIPASEKAASIIAEILSLK